MESTSLSSEVLFALEQVANERRVIEAFKADPTNENVGIVTLQVSGIEHDILIHDEDVMEFADLLLKFNKKERARLERTNKSRFCLQNLLSKVAL